MVLETDNDTSSWIVVLPSVTRTCMTQTFLTNGGAFQPGRIEVHRRTGWWSWCQDTWRWNACKSKISRDEHLGVSNILEFESFKWKPLSRMNDIRHLGFWNGVSIWHHRHEYMAWHGTHDFMISSWSLCFGARMLAETLGLERNCLRLLELSTLWLQVSFAQHLDTSP